MSTKPVTTTATQATVTQTTTATQTESWMALSLISDLISRLQSPLPTTQPPNTPTSSSGVIPESEKTRSAVESSPSASPPRVLPALPARRDDAPPTPTPRPTPVTLLSSLDFSDLSVRDIEQSVEFTRIGRREVAHYGVRYQYGRTVHHPRPYPEGGPFPNIISRLSQHIEGFGPEWSCTVTKYAGGKSTMPFHSDRDNSDVYCISLGASRPIHFRSIRGEPDTQVHQLHHGSVYHMSEESQDFWEHGLPATGSTTGTRISLTFRNLKEPEGRPKLTGSQAIPPIQRSNRPSTRPPLKRLLYLGDSMNSGLPVQLWGSEYQVVQRPLYRLEQLEQHEHLFAGCAVVVISAGINDISRYQHTAQSLMDYMRPLLERLSSQYGDTKFVFSSILRTNFPWLNSEVEALNEHLFQWTTQLPNARLLDTHDYCSFLAGKGWTIVDPEGNGVHLTGRVKEEIGRLLTNCTRAFAGGWAKVERWPLRERFRVRI